MLNKYFIKKLFILSLLITGTGQLSVTFSQDGWERMEDMSIERTTHGTCVYKNRIYVFGGIDQNVNWFASVESYDIFGNDWTEHASLQTPSGFLSVGGINEKIYAVGGNYQGPNSGLTTDDNLEYDPELDSWVEKKNFPVTTAQMASATLNNKFYMFGGYIFPETTPSEILRKVYTYDPSTDSWDSVASMPNPHIEGDAVVLNGKIYVIGGIRDYLEENHIEGKLDMYDPGTKTWTELKNIPVPVSRHVSIVHNNKIYVFGGETEDYIWGTYGGSDLIQEYNPETDTWQRLSGMPFNRSGSKGHKVGDYFYLIGGEDGEDNRLKDVWRFDLNNLIPLSIETEEYVSKNNIFSFHQNYPNPFSNKSKIRYKLFASGQVEMEIYDMSGKKLTTLVNENQIPGNYEVTWNAEGVSPGIYFCKMRVNGFEGIKKLIKNM